MNRHFNNHHRTLLIFFVWWASLFFAESALSKTDSKVRAAYIYNISKFVKWPNDIGPNFNICLTGRDSSNDAIQAIQGKSVKGRPVRVYQLSDNSNISDCHILHIGQENSKFLESYFQAIKKRPVLTVSSIEGFVENGGMIGLILLGNVIKFEINLAQAKEHKLTCSSKLLELANKVVK